MVTPSPSASAAAATAAGIDPLLSLIVGAFGAALLGLLGAWIQHRREQQKWVRDQRLDAYAEYLLVTERQPSFDTDPDVFAIYLDERQNALMRVQLVGSAAVVAAADALQRSIRIRSLLLDDEMDSGRAHQASEKNDPSLFSKEFNAAVNAAVEMRQQFLAAARKELRVKD